MEIMSEIHFNPCDIFCNSTANLAEYPNGDGVSPGDYVPVIIPFINNLSFINCMNQPIQRLMPLLEHSPHKCSKTGRMNFLSAHNHTGVKNWDDKMFNSTPKCTKNS